MGEENRLNVEEVQQKLIEPFNPKDIEWRVMRSFKGKNKKAYAWVAPYIESRAIMNRLDSVVGIANWEDEYKTIHNGIICGIRIWFSDEKSRIKWDGSDLTSFEATKGGISGALKRAAVQWGIGRYLYGIKEQMVEIYSDTKKGQNYINDKKQQIVGSWDTPKLPSWALPKGIHQNGEGRKPDSNTRQGKENQAPGHNKQNQQLGREGLVAYIERFEKQIGLDKTKQYIVRIFNKANNTKYQNANFIKEKTTNQELLNYYRVLKPVNDVCLATQSYNCTLEQVLNFVQIIKPEVKIESLYNLFFILNAEDVKRVLEIAKQDYQNRQQEQPA